MAITKNEVIGCSIIGGVGIGFVVAGSVGAIILGALSVPISNYYYDDIKKIMEKR